MKLLDLGQGLVVLHHALSAWPGWEDAAVPPEQLGDYLREFDALMTELIGWSRAHDCRGIDALVLPGMRESKNYFERFGLTARAILVHKDLRG